MISCLTHDNCTVSETQAIRLANNGFRKEDQPMLCNLISKMLASSKINILNHRQMKKIDFINEIFFKL